MKRIPALFVAILLVSSTLPAAAGSDAKAVEIAGAVMERLGGQEAWNATRYVRWDFFGSRTHYWDKQTGDLRIEIPERRNDDGELQRPELLVLMNVDTKRGRVWAAGEPTEGEKLQEYLDLGHQAWINDSYWMFMPYKLLDPGVTLEYAGDRELEDGRPCDALDLTFADGVGYTPENRYVVCVARDTGLVEQWSFFADAEDEKARFTLPWAGWRQFGRIWLATEHGQGKDWKIAVEADMPRALFTERDEAE
jgi:hypothetical protein